jgi:hypothetical protein
VRLMLMASGRSNESLLVFDLTCLPARFQSTRDGLEMPDEQATQGGRRPMICTSLFRIFYLAGMEMQMSFSGSGDIGFISINTINFRRAPNVATT